MNEQTIESTQRLAERSFLRYLEGIALVVLVGCCLSFLFGRPTRKPTVLIMGDSISHDIRCYGRPWYVNLESEYAITNIGEGGAVSRYLMPDSNALFTTPEQRQQIPPTGAHYDVLVVIIGTNDAALGITQHEYSLSLRRVLASGIADKIILCGAPYNMRYKGKQDLAIPFRRCSKLLAESTGSMYLDLSKRIPHDARFYDGTLVHMNEAGTRLMLAAIHEAIRATTGKKAVYKDQPPL